MNYLSALSLLMALCLLGCSHKAAYDNIRLHNQQQCLNEPPPTYAECMERANKSYTDYVRENNEILDK